MALAGEPQTPRFVFCGSMTFFSYMRELRDELSAHAIQVALPDSEEDLDIPDEGQFELFRRKVILRHLERVRAQRTLGILVLNFDKHGIRDYIGPSTFAEIAAARVSNKRIFLLQEMPEMFRNTLAAWDAVPLRGKLDPLLDLYRKECLRLPDRQLNLFAGSPASGFRGFSRIFSTSTS